MAGKFSYSPSEFACAVKGSPEQSSLPETQSLETHQAAFAWNRARVLRFTALRRLTDRTQIVGPGEGSTPRTHLAHSLEVVQTSRGTASESGADEDLTELAGLTHDIGHPSYGHNGEHTLNEIAAGCGGFKGDAQTLRILTHLEPKVLDGTGEPCRPNLTWAASDTACKYLWTSVDPDGQPRHKYGAYQEDAAILQQIRQGVPYSKQCPEAQIMDWSDDIAYSVHDVEDDIISGRTDPGTPQDMVELAVLADKGATVLGGDPTELIETTEHLTDLPVVSVAASYDGPSCSLVALRRMTSELADRFVTASVAGTYAASGSTPPPGRYDADFAAPNSILAGVTTLRTIIVPYVMDLSRHIRRQEHERDHFFQLIEYLQEGTPGTPDLIFRWLYSWAESDQTWPRATVDRLVPMTGSRVERLNHQIAGMAATWG